MSRLPAHNHRLLWCLTLIAILDTRVTRGQTSPTATSESMWQQRLIHQPLYLRGFWMGFDLNFDATGKPIGNASDQPHPGPLTLSGVDVQDVSVKGNRLVLHAQHVALVADAQGVLEPRPLVQTTRMYGTVQKQFRSKEIVKISIEADSSGSFDAPVRAVFANGLAELAPAAPPYWRCYSDAYFVGDATGRSTADMVESCAKKPVNPSSAAADTQPRILTQPQPRGTREAMELHVSGISEVYIEVNAHGIPTGSQIVKPLGAGLDEDALQALAQCRFAPATLDGVPVAAGIFFSMQYR